MRLHVKTLLDGRALAGVRLAARFAPGRARTPDGRIVAANQQSFASPGSAIGAAPRARQMKGEPSRGYEPIPQTCSW
jgi:hypothetical protein